ncbi:MAG: M14 family zinc carboxypeptidase [Zetaproteobacteria bacterium]|nr:M14 family zinc carboxypeptidase [Zetaproteobacteria bacterium]
MYFSYVWLVLPALFCWERAAYGHGLLLDAQILERGYAKIPHVSPYNIADYHVREADSQAVIADYCRKVSQEFKRYGWEDNPCGEVQWSADLQTASGMPLIYASFGSGRETTLFMGGVHPDELSPIQLAFRFARYLSNNPDLYQKQGLRVVVAPLVAPDGFFRDRPLRTNGRIDVNRNFFTMDWYDKAHHAWQHRTAGAGRYFPGYFPNTEVETLFQVWLVDAYTPDKLFSVHAPLGFLDYDGPGDQKPSHLSRTEKKAKQYVYEVSKQTENYRVVDYSFYPGSLGNFAGNERKVPTITLELEATNPRGVHKYWEKFLPGFVRSVNYPFRRDHRPEPGNASRFFAVYDEVFLKLQRMGLSLN